MMDFRLKRYKSDFEHSYTFGVFPTLELLFHQRERVLGVAIHPDGYQNEGVAEIQAICQEYEIPCEEQPNTFSRLKARGNDYAIGVFQKYYQAVDPTSNHVVLVQPSGMGNLGTIIRAMLGFSFKDLAIIEPAADHFHPKVVRASMGAIFQTRITTFTDFETYQGAYPRNIYPLMTDGDMPINQTRFYDPYALVFGSEGSGLDESFRQQWTSLRIPQSGEIDSLNIAISVGISLYQASLAKEG